jgi:hypothetical protein
MSLRDELTALYEEGQRVWPEQARAIIERNSAELAATGMDRDAAGAGDRAPGFDLPSAAGSRVTLDGLLAEGPVVLSFHPGAGRTAGGGVAAGSGRVAVARGKARAELRGAQ